MVKVELKEEETINRIVSHQEGVKEVLQDHAQGIAASAETILRNNSGGDFTNGGWPNDEADIKVTQGWVDSYVWLVDSAALSIEYGHMLYNQYGPTGHWVEGLMVIHRAAGLGGG